MKLKTFQIFVIVLGIIAFFSCRNEKVDGGPCTYETITKTVKAINVEKDSTEIVTVEFEVVDDGETIILGAEDFEIMNVEVEMSAFENDTSLFILGGEENIEGACQPFIWNRIK